MQKNRKFRWDATLLVSTFIALSGILWYGMTADLRAQEGGTSTIYLPFTACSDNCPTITPTATPTPTLESLLPSLTAIYAVTVTDGIQFGAANIISGTHAAGGIQATSTVSLPLYLDLYEPVNAPPGKRPVVMWMFGSGFTNITANRKGGFVPIAQELAARGYVVISIDYRTAYQNPVVAAQAQPYLQQIIAPVDNSWVPFVFTPPLFPYTLTEDQYERAIAAAYDDGLTALKWIASQAATRQLDMDRLALMGSSSGTTTENSLAYLSDDIGVTTPKIAAMLHLWGGMDYSRGDGLTEIEADEAPLFMIHSINDTAAQGGVDYINAKEMGERAAAIGLTYELITLTPDPNGITPALQAGSGHGLSQVPILEALSDNGQTLFQRLVNFANSVLP